MNSVRQRAIRRSRPLDGAESAAGRSFRTLFRDEPDRHALQGIWRYPGEQPLRVSGLRDDKQRPVAPDGVQRFAGQPVGIISVLGALPLEKEAPAGEVTHRAL